MSIERDLLARVLTSELWSVQEELQAEIKQLLSQPEQEQEPVAWKDRTYGNLHHVDYGNSIPLYTAPPKRTSLELEIADVCGSEDYREGFKDGALYAEKCHGIGGGE